ncbi:hypothetical protein DFH06DRAFT_1316637 [Mycena polygramma]|nr:hypothetical protein DFH06DRAFT_1316637 [Mycena polygramma]
MCLHRPRPPIELLPVELLLDIFDRAITAAGEDVILTGHTFYLLTDVRDTIGQVNRSFRRAIRDHPSFWRQLHIDCNTAPGFVQRHVSRLGLLTIDVSINLEYTEESSSSEPCSSDDESESGSTSSSSRPTLEETAAVVQRCLVAVKPSMHLWRNAHIWVTRDLFLLDLLDIFSTTGVPELTTLFFACRSFGFSPGPCDTLLLDSPPLFNRRMPKLKILRLLASALRWGDPEYFGNLEMLDVQNVPALAWPTISSFVSTLTSSSALHTLVLGGGGVIGGNGLVITPFTLPSLATLTIYYSGEAGRFIRLLAAGTFPALTSFTAINFDAVA